MWADPTERVVSTGKLPSAMEKGVGRGRSGRALLPAGAKRPREGLLIRQAKTSLFWKRKSFGKGKRAGILESTFSSESNICGMTLTAICSCEECYGLFCCPTEGTCTKPLLQSAEIHSLQES